jgi:putative cardiolipin synthase
MGVSTFERVKNLAFGFRDANQRMHDKVVIFDDAVAITGGRNMADEYFDFDREYSFRDRDVLVYGKAFTSMKQSFERFWKSDLSASLSLLLSEKLPILSEADIKTAYKILSDYANKPSSYALEVRDSIKKLSDNFTAVMNKLRWSDAYFIYDFPGKNDGASGLCVAVKPRKACTN